MNLFGKIKNWFSQRKSQLLVQDIEESLPSVNFGGMVVTDPPKEAKHVCPFLIAQERFNPKTDLMVISETLVDSLADYEKDWIEQQGDRVLCFPGNVLTNCALVRNGHFRF